MRARLRVPTQLGAVSITVLAVGSCDAARVAGEDVRNDGGAIEDVLPETASIDVRDVVTSFDDVMPCDVLPGGAGYECIPDPSAKSHATCPTERSCEPATCPAGCMSCYGGAFSPAGFRCVEDLRADVRVTCPEARVCTMSDCPAGCRACNDPYRCVPRIETDASSCTPVYVCNGSDCAADCEPFA